MCESYFMFINDYILVTIMIKDEINIDCRLYVIISINYQHTLNG